MSVQAQLSKTPATQFSNFIGWQGITVTVPEDWNVGAVSGDRSSGYFRVDDDAMVRLEVKWSKPSGAVDLKKALDSYLESLKKGRAGGRKLKFLPAGRKPHDAPGFDSQTDVRLVSRRKKRKAEILGFTWSGSQTAWGTIWRCGDCGRVVIAQVAGRPQEDVRSLAEKVIGSLEDHDPEGWDKWGAYGFVFEIPDDFSLEKNRFVTGHLEFRFARGKTREESITVSRWGLADVLLSQSGLGDWLDTTLPSRHKGIDLDRREVVIKDHSGAYFRGSDRNLPRKLKQGVKRLVTRSSPIELIINAWHCKEDNKIFSVECNVRRKDDYLLEDVTDSVVCHED